MKYEIGTVHASDFPERSILAPLESIMNSKTVSLAALGLSEHETRVLKTVSSVSRYGRPCHYAFTADTPDNDLAVFICNADDPEAVARWNIYRVAFPDAVVIMTTRRHGLADGPYLTLHGPLSARQVLTALDGIFAQEQTEAQTVSSGRLQRVLRRTVEGFIENFQAPGMQTA